MDHASADVCNEDSELCDEYFRMFNALSDEDRFHFLDAWA